MFNKLHLLFILMLLGNFTFGQLDLEQEELKLNDELLSFRKEFTKSGMDQASLSFASKMKSFLSNEGAFDYNFKHLETVAILDSPDGKLRIVNWNIEYPDFSYSFAGFVMHRNKTKVSIYELTDALDPYEVKPKGVISENK